MSPFQMENYACSVDVKPPAGYTHGGPTAHPNLARLKISLKLSRWFNKSGDIRLSFMCQEVTFLIQVSNTNKQTNLWSKCVLIESSFKWILERTKSIYFNPVKAFFQLQTLSPRKWIVCEEGCLLSPFDCYTFSDNFMKINPFPPSIWLNDKTVHLAEQSSWSKFMTLPWNQTFKPQNLKPPLDRTKVEDTH